MSRMAQMLGWLLGGIGMRPPMSPISQMVGGRVRPPIAWMAQTCQPKDGAKPAPWWEWNASADYTDFVDAGWEDASRNCPPKVGFAGAGAAWCVYRSTVIEVTFQWSCVPMRTIIMDDHDPQTYAIIGAAMEVHSVLGKGFLESVYQEAFAMELVDRGIPFRQEIPLPVHYKNKRLNTSFRCDFICFEEIVVEIKAISTLTSADESQLINYLTATRIARGLIINFGSASLQCKRRVVNWKG